MNPALINLIAFLAVLVAIVMLSLAGKATDLSIMTGLVGVLGSFKPWQWLDSGPKDGGAMPVKVENAPTDPVPTQDTAELIDQFKEGRS